MVSPNADNSAGKLDGCDSDKRRQEFPTSEHFPGAASFAHNPQKKGLYCHVRTQSSCHCQSLSHEYATYFCLWGSSIVYPHYFSVMNRAHKWKFMALCQ